AASTSGCAYWNVCPIACDRSATPTWMTSIPDTAAMRSALPSPSTDSIMTTRSSRSFAAATCSGIAAARYSTARPRLISRRPSGGRSCWLMGSPRLCASQLGPRPEALGQRPVIDPSRHRGVLDRHPGAVEQRDLAGGGAPRDRSRDHLPDPAADLAALDQSL